MTLRHVEIFVAIYQTNSITKAAKRLHISQPTVSVALRELEEYYDTKLFDRLSHKLYITPFGELIYEQARSLLDSWDILTKTSQSINHIRVASGTAVGKLLLPSIIKSFSKKYTDARISVCTGDATMMSHHAMENSVDFVIAETVANIPGLSSRVLQRYPVVAVCHKNNPLSTKKIIVAEDLTGQNLLLREPGSLTRQVVNIYFQQHDLPVTPIWESYSVQTLLNATSENLGISFLSLDLVLAFHSPELIILNIPDFHGERYVNLCYHKNKYFTPLMDAFIQHYDNSVKQMLISEMANYKMLHPENNYVFPAL